MWTLGATGFTTKPWPARSLLPSPSFAQSPETGLGGGRSRTSVALIWVQCPHPFCQRSITTPCTGTPTRVL